MVIHEITADNAYKSRGIIGGAQLKDLDELEMCRRTSIGAGIMTGSLGVTRETLGMCGKAFSYSA